MKYLPDFFGVCVCECALKLLSAPDTHKKQEFFFFFYIVKENLMRKLSSSGSSCTVGMCCKIIFIAISLKHSLLGGTGQHLPQCW